MAGQGIERREMLRVLAMAAAARAVPRISPLGFRLRAPRRGRRHSGPAARYTPQFFTADEYATLDQLTALILPSDGTPGARDAGVSEFIDFMVAHDPAIQYDFRFGLAWLDTRANQAQQRPFRDLEPAAQTALLEPLAARVPASEGLAHPGLEEGRAFFAHLRRYTLMGFYTSRVGLEQLGYPGLQIYTESQGCPHPDDPEHLHLRRLDADRCPTRSTTPS